jgi:hypothetical protein
VNWKQRGTGICSRADTGESWNADTIKVGNIRDAWYPRCGTCGLLQASVSFQETGMLYFAVAGLPLN